MCKNSLSKLCCVCVNLLIVSAAAAAEFDFKPVIAVSEEFNDNIFETQIGKRSEYITSFRPGAVLSYNTPLWRSDMAYNFIYRNYARNSKDNELIHDAGLKASISLIDNFFYTDISDSYHRVSLDITRDVTLESPFINQTDQNIATFSPFLLWRHGTKTALKTGYRYTDIRYWGTGVEKREHSAFCNLNHELTPKISIVADYIYSKTITPETTAGLDKHDLSSGFRFNYADKSFLYGTLGNSWQNFDNGIDKSFMFWAAGITHDLGFAVGSVETRVQLSEDPLTSSTKETIYSGKLEKELNRGNISFFSSYSEFVATQTGIKTQRKLAFGASCRYELIRDLVGNLSATSERFSLTTTDDLPYRFTGIAGLNYAFNYGISAGINYTYVGYLRSLNSPELAKEINRAVVEFRKAF